VSLELEYVDGDARAWLDGVEVAVLADDLDVEAAVAALDDEAGGPQRLRIAAEGGSLVVEDVRVDHDLYYWSGRNQPPNEPRQGESIVVPADSYFMLGDNTSSSHDSRRWTAQGVRVKPGRPDGLAEIWWDSQTNWTAEPPDEDDPPELGGKRKVTDLDGIVRTWHAQDEVESLQKRVRFVTRDLIVGRAFFALVFWPLDEIPRRFRLIH
jgi:hypothetical protein